MKWTYLLFANIVIFILSLLGIILIKVIPGVDLPNSCFVIPLIFFAMIFVSLVKSILETNTALRNSYRDFLEYDKALQPADTDDFPSSYVREINRVSEELTDAGLMVAGDYCILFSGLGKKSFSRILRSPDGKVWAEVERERPNLLFRLAVTIFGMGCNLRTRTRIIIFLQNGKAQIIENMKLLTAKPTPGIIRSEHPNQSARELLKIALDMKRTLEENEADSIRSLDLDAFRRAICTTDIYFVFKHNGLEFPSQERLKKEGFSDSAIEKYRKICLEFLPPAKEKTADVQTIPVASDTQTIAEAPAAVDVAQTPSEPVTQTQLPAEGMSPELEAAFKSYKSSVSSFGTAVLLSAVNVVLIATGAEMSFPFSAFFPTMVTAIGKESTKTGNMEVLAAIGLALAIFSVLLYAICWLLSKKYRFFILIGLLIFVLDSLLLIPFIPEGGSSIWVDVAFHVWILWALFSGVKAWRKLKRMQTSLPENTPDKGARAVKGCLIGCGGLTGLFVLLIAAIVGIVVANIPPPVKFVDIRLNAAEDAELTQAFVRLENALSAKAPKLLNKRKPLSPEQRSSLKRALQGKSIDALTRWYEFFSGTENCELIPGGRITDIESAITLRNMCDHAFTRLTTPGRSMSMMLLSGIEDDGYYLGITPKETKVSTHMFSASGEDDSVASLAGFINLIAEAIERNEWSYDQDGKIVESDKDFRDYIKKSQQPDKHLQSTSGNTP